MTEILNNAGAAVQVVAYAYVVLLAIALVVMTGAPIAGRMLGHKAKIPNPVEALVGVGFIFGLPAAIAAALALAVTPFLLALPLPLVGWLLIACMALYGLYDAKQRPSGGMEGCTTMFVVGFAGFGLCWAGAAILLADPPVGNAASFVRPLLVAAPFALFAGTHSRGNRVKQAIGFELFIAIFVAIAFLPVEQGFAGDYLPASDWLRYPIMGAFVFAAYPLLAIPLGLIFGSRAIQMQKTLRAMATLGFIGLSLGLIWAVTRLLF